MLERTNCPICGGASWETIARQTYRRSDTALTTSVRKRYDILFDLWVPDNSELTISYRLCDLCGFVIYTPRPTDEELAAKYERLGGASSSTVNGPVVTAVDRRRSREIHAAVEPHLSSGARILDFGGGTGSLMVSFLESEYSCSAVDYAPEMIPGVKRLATSLSELDGDHVFELIVASHVIEHVVDPLHTVAELGAHLVVGGVLYVEVPFELLGSAPNRREPVTHVNFFSEPSLREALERAGLDVLQCWTTATTHSGGYPELSVCALARRPGSDATGPLVLRREPRTQRRADVFTVKRLVDLGPVGKASFLARRPRMLLKPLLRFQARRRAH